MRPRFKACLYGLWLVWTFWLVGFGFSFRVQSLGFRLYRVWALGFRVGSVGLRVLIGIAGSRKTGFPEGLVAASTVI